MRPREPEIERDPFRIPYFSRGGTDPLGTGR